MYVDPGSACMHNSQYLSIKSQGRYVYFLGTLVCLSRLYFFFFSQDQYHGGQTSSSENQGPAENTYS